MSRSALAALAVALLAAGCGAGPTSPSADVVFTQVVAGGDHTCALDSDGQAWCWGSNGRGELGITDGRSSSDVPLAVNGTTRFRLLSAGTRHTCGIDTDGRLWCWGANDAGQLGDGTHHDRREPHVVPVDLRFADVSAGTTHTCGVALDGRLWCWGRNDAGQLGNPDMSADGAALPVPVTGDLRFSRVAAGAVHTCAVTVEGAALCWGSNRAGELGTGTLDPSPLPARVAGGRVYDRMSAGLAHSCGATSGGDLYCWGTNAGGELGIPGWTRAGTPVGAPAGEAVTMVDSSPDGGQTCAGSFAAVTCWGGVELGGVAYRTAPSVVTGLPQGQVTSLGVGTSHACAVVDGDVLCWGAGGAGQLGDGAAADATQPVPVSR